MAGTSMGHAGHAGQDKANGVLHNPHVGKGANVDTVEIRLDPGDIAINNVFAGLRSNRGGKDYLDGVALLAGTIKSQGQKQAVLIRTNTTGGDQSYELVAGHRRYDAAKMEGLELLCRFEDLDDDAAMRAALIENFQREDFSEMDKARIILGLRVNGKMKTKAIAEYLGVSGATVTETEKLLGLPKDVQQAVEEGKLTKSAALEVAPVAAEARPEVMKKAKGLAAAEQDAEVDKKLKAGGAGGKAGAAAAAASAKPPKVEGKHIRKAIRNTEGAVEKHKAPNRAEILDMLEMLSGPAFAKPMTQLADLFTAWIKGDVTDKQLKAAWDDVGDCIAAGKQESSIPGAKVLERLQAGKDQPKAAKADKAAVAKKAGAKKATATAPALVKKAPGKAKGKVKVKAKAKAPAPKKKK